MANKKLLGLLAMGAMFDGGLGLPSSVTFDEKKVSGKLKGKSQKQNMKRFEIDGIVIYALNEKNAIRKAKQIK